ncbi:MAG: guanitoxin biosynthesis MBL fold metallo-hydrolase GntH [Dinoroseobacter sp.]|nr:guanitoxin biosynthesis MBL fold metallo-hydrolase GntH [Dinoroseobacter sp.]
MNTGFSRNLIAGCVLGAFALTTGPVETDKGASIVSGAAHAAGGVVDDPTGTVPDRYVYYPGTEALSEGEVRVIACGTGMPDSRRGQASACFLFEFGNGEKLFFDLGTGAMRNVNSLMIPSEYLTKVFISHLHTDHWGDLASLWAGGWTAGRPVPLEVWGPSGREPDMGTAYAIDGFLRAYNWDYQTRAYKITPVPGGITVNEFDYRGENAVIYEENGVTIRSWPAIHSLDGPVSFSLEWNDLKFVFSSDTYPNTWWNEYARDADLAIHECFVAVPTMVAKMGFTPESALLVGTQIHTAPEAFGKVMTEIEPRMAVAYHFFKDFDTTAEVYSRIRTTYDGPLSLAEDFMVWNITEDEIRVRMAVTEEATWSPPLTGEAQPPGGDADREAFSENSGVALEDMTYSDFISGGTWDGVEEALRGVYKEAEEALGQEFPYPGDE